MSSHTVALYCGLDSFLLLYTLRFVLLVLRYTTQDTDLFLFISLSLASLGSRGWGGCSSHVTLNSLSLVI